ncbi:hypothetical protein EDD17DRAFT_1511079 [Pisolithus thermaeus]|nr:hypothetical protein EV401DRAFT_1889251 [Pisolithus croceorrhizus]KAI6159798.1 hypothetical protein EDD17DRAFT_1511079 [Pisolithus thermaeus]
MSYYSMSCTNAPGDHKWDKLTVHKGHTRGQTSSILNMETVESIDYGGGWTSILEVGSVDLLGHGAWISIQILKVGLVDFARGWTSILEGDFSSESSVSGPWWGMDFLPEDGVTEPW